MNRCHQADEETERRRSPAAIGVSYIGHEILYLPRRTREGHAVSNLARDLSHVALAATSMGKLHLPLGAIGTVAVVAVALLLAAFLVAVLRYWVKPFWSDEE